jgi:isopropylmalate/homocitrate/citramalate synthase
MGIKTGIQLNRLTELSQKVEEIFAFPLSAHKPIVGANAFSHESGLHINAILSHPISYEPINPTLVGQKRRFYLGKFSGSSAILDAMQSKLKINNINLPDEIIKKIVQDVKAKHEQTSKQDTQELYQQTKKLIEKVQAGITDTEFFEIINNDAGDYLKGTWAENPNNKSKSSGKKVKRTK